MSNFEDVFKAAIKGMHDSNRKVYGPQLANVMKPVLEAMKPVFKLIYEKGLTDAIPEGCVVVPKTIPENVIERLKNSSYHWGENTKDYFSPIYEMMVEEAARGGNE